MKSHDTAFAKVNYSEPIDFFPPGLKYKPFEPTKNTKELAEIKESQKLFFNSQFNNLLKPNNHWASEDIGIRIETLLFDRVKQLCNGKVCSLISEMGIEIIVMNKSSFYKFIIQINFYLMISNFSMKDLQNWKST